MLKLFGEIWGRQCIQTRVALLAGYAGMSVVVQSSTIDGDYRSHSTGGSGNELLSTTFWSGHTGLTHTKEPLKKTERFILEAKSIDHSRMNL